VSHAARKLKKNGKLILFVSQGGTCRDPMATVIAEEALKVKMPEQNNIKFMGCGIGPSAANEASFAAQHVIHEIYGKELLKTYKPNVVTQELIRAADLILVMDRHQLNNKVFPENKTFLIKAFFGLKGDVKDPYPDGRDEKTISRYRTCAEELKSIIENRFEYLRNFVTPTGAVN
jgi:protein-tyrosine-phosphatase